MTPDPPFPWVDQYAMWYKVVILCGIFLTKNQLEHHANKRRHTHNQRDKTNRYCGWL